MTKYVIKLVTHLVTMGTCISGTKSYFITSTI